MSKLKIVIKLGEDNLNLLKDIDLEDLSFIELHQAMKLSMKLNETLLEMLKAIDRVMESTKET